VKNWTLSEIYAVSHGFAVTGSDLRVAIMTAFGSEGIGIGETLK
jgi:hypothetical protein